MTSDRLYTDWNSMLAGWIQRVEEMNANPLLSHRRCTTT